MTGDLSDTRVEPKPFEFDMTRYPVTFDAPAYSLVVIRLELDKELLQGRVAGTSKKK